jgi:hypothetical protein
MLALLGCGVETGGVDSTGESFGGLLRGAVSADGGCPPTGTATTSPMAVPQGISRVILLVSRLSMVARRA